jgi:hypothetical protein
VDQLLYFTVLMMCVTCVCATAYLLSEMMQPKYPPQYNKSPVTIQKNIITKPELVKKAPKQLAKILEFKSKPWYYSSLNKGKRK